MAAPSLAPSSDRNLLFGILALQMDFISRDALIQALGAWVLDKNKPFGQILRDQGHLTEHRLRLLQEMVEEHLRAHHDDSRRSLAALMPPASIHQELRSIADADVQASLDSVAPSRDTDSGATGPYQPQPEAAAQPRPESAADASRYRVLRLHARGGLGEVFVAKDTELDRQVALKEIREKRAYDPDSRSRFLLEAKITGGLEHPGIVPVHGLGQHEDGRPYYAMRLIQGDTFKEAIRRFHQADVPGRQPGERILELRKLLGQFVTVCNAVAYAHSRGVINRDIKDDNIMLGKFGETLVIDWGLAKVIGQPEGKDESQPMPQPSGEDLATQVGTALGTPAYMSPEAAAGRLDLLSRSSDIYSLGATLYKVLTGRPPVHGSDAGEMLRKVSRGKWLPARQVKKDVPAALEAICAKAMALKPEDRYASALELAADVEHWLADEPVTAYRERWPTLLGRWSRRHKSLVSAAGALLFTAVLGLGVGLAIVQHEKGRTQTALVAEGQRRQQARQALDAMSSQIIDAWLGKQKELLPEHKAFLEKALASYEEFAQDTRQDEESRAGVAAASHRVCDIYRKLGQAKEAEAAYRRSTDLYVLLAAEFPNQPDFRQELARNHENLGDLLTVMSRAQEAETAYRDGLALRKQLADDFPDRPEFRTNLATSQMSLGNLLSATGRPHESETAFRDALALNKQPANDFPNRPDFRLALARSYLSLGLLLKDTGRPQKAETAYRDGLAIRKQLADDFPNQPDFRQELAWSHNNLGTLLWQTGRIQEAETAFRDALAIQKHLADDFPNWPDLRSYLAGHHNNLGLVLHSTGRLKEAETAFRDALALHKQLAADFANRPKIREDLARTQGNLGMVLNDTGRLPEAETVYRDAYVVLKRLAADFPNVPGYQANVASTLLGLADVAHGQHHDSEAIRLLDEALPAIQKALGSNPRQPFYRGVLRSIRRSLAQARLGLGEHAAAAAAAEEMLPIEAQPAKDAYTAARVLAQCVPLADKDAKLSESKRTELAQGYADRAMALLRQATDKGYNDAANMKKDKDLDSLRSRDDFKKLLADLEKSAPPDNKPSAK